MRNTKPLLVQGFCIVVQNTRPGCGLCHMIAGKVCVMTGQLHGLYVDGLHLSVIFIYFTRPLF